MCVRAGLTVACPDAQGLGVCMPRDCSGRVAVPVQYSDVLPRLQAVPGFGEMQEVEGVPRLWIGPAISARSPSAYVDKGITHVIGECACTGGRGR